MNNLEKAKKYFKDTVWQHPIDESQIIEFADNFHSQQFKKDILSLTDEMIDNEFSQNIPFLPRESYTKMKHKREAAKWAKEFYLKQNEDE